MTTEPTRAAPPALPAGPPPSRTREYAATVGRLAIRLAFDLLVIDAAVESWLAGSPLRTGLATAAFLYFALTAYVVSKGGRVGGRGWLMDPWAGAVVFLGFLVACTWAKEWTVQGITVIHHGTPVVLSASMIAVVGAAAVRMVGPGGAKTWWVRAPMLVVCGYACTAFGRAIPAGTPFVDLLTGHGFWLRLPWWGQGTWLGAFVVLPVAFLRELGASIARLEGVPYLRWMLVFGCACWLAFNVVSL